MSVPRPRNFIKQTAGAPLRPSDEGPNVGDRGDQCRAADAGTVSQPRPRGDEKRARWTLVNLGLTGSRMVEKGRPGHASERRQMPRHAIGAAAVRCELRRGVSGALSSKSDPAEPAAREVLFALLGYRHGPGGGLDDRAPDRAWAWGGVDAMRHFRAQACFAQAPVEPWFLAVVRIPASFWAKTVTHWWRIGVVSGPKSDAKMRHMAHFSWAERLTPPRNIRRFFS